MTMVKYNILYHLLRQLLETGQPIAWCLSDHESGEVIEAFLSSIKARSPSTAVNVMMTDDGNYIYIYRIAGNFRNRNF